jgi:hypothetical protein
VGAGVDHADAAGQRQPGRFGQHGFYGIHG